MLVIIMHNNREYLKYLAQLAVREGVENFTIVSQKGIGTSLIGGDDSFVFSRGSNVETYEKAFVAVVSDGDKKNNFLKAIYNDDYLEQLNMQDKGFICDVPLRALKIVDRVG